MAHRAASRGVRPAAPGRHRHGPRAGAAGHHHQDAGDPGDPGAHGLALRQHAARGHFDAGALGFASDGLIVVRDAAKLALKDRVAVNQAVADDNRDRKAVYREVAVANGHPEWEAQIRDGVRQAVDRQRASRAGGTRSGGGWKQK